MLLLCVDVKWHVPQPSSWVNPLMDEKSVKNDIIIPCLTLQKLVLASLSLILSFYSDKRDQFGLSDGKLQNYTYSKAKLEETTSSLALGKWY